MESHLLHSLEILTEDTVQQVGVLVAGLAVLDVLRSVEEPEGDLELLGVGDNRNNLGDLLLAELTSSLVHVNIALLANDIGESATNTLKTTIIIVSEKNKHTLIAVRANMTFCLPSTFVLQIRRMCWKSGDCIRIDILKNIP